MIDISANHSIYKENFQKGIPANKQNLLVDVNSLREGDSLRMPPFGFDNELRTNKGLFFSGTKNLAWLYGFFAAEG